MGSLSKYVSFTKPAEKVWTVWSDVEKTPEWVEGVKESRITTDVREGRGMEWEEKVTMGGQTVQMQHEVCEWEAAKKTWYYTRLPMGATMETKAEFRNTAHGSELSVEISWNLGILSMMVSDEKFEEMIDKAFSKTAERLKTRAEA